MELTVRELTLVLKDPGIKAYLQEDPNRYMKITYHFKSPIRKLEIANYISNLFHSNLLDYKRLNKSTVLIFEKTSETLNSPLNLEKVDSDGFSGLSFANAFQGSLVICQKIYLADNISQLSNENLNKSIIQVQDQNSLPRLTINSFVSTHSYINFDDFYERQNSLSNELTSDLFECIDKYTGMKRFVKKYHFGSDLKKLSNNNFLNETNNMKMIDHKNVAHIYDVINDGKDYFIIFEYLEGGSVLKKIRNVKTFTENQAACFMEQMVAAVRELHRVNIMHSSIKLESFWFDQDSNRDESILKLIDFSLSEHLHNSNPLNLKVFSGFYTAPESILGEASYEVDIWALGIVLHIMLLGRPPFYSSSQETMFNKILNEEFKFNPKISTEANDLLSKMLNKKPNLRIPSKEILNHDWFNSNRNPILDQSPNTTQTLSLLMTNLKRFSHENSNRIIIFYYIANFFFQPGCQTDAKNLFRLLDIDKDGHLSEDDIEKSIKKYSLEMSIDDLFKVFDFNQDKLISFSDFVLAVFDTSTINNELLTKVFKALCSNQEDFIALPLLNNFPNLIRDDMPNMKSCLESAKISLDQFIDFMLRISNQP